MKQIRIAQIGTSTYSHGNEIFTTLKENPDLFEIVGYALPEGERERFPWQMQAFAGYREMTVEEILSDPSIEAVTIETEEIYLTKYARMAAASGKHIHMEKPGGTCLSDFEELISLVKQAGTVFHVGYMYRYNPAIRDILCRVKAGEIGDVISVEAHMSGWRNEQQTAFLSAFPGGMMFFLGCHLIDLVLQLQGMPKKIFPFNKASGVYDLPSKDFSMALLEYEHGVSFVKTTQAERGGFLRRQLVVTGTKGRFEVRPLEINVSYPMQRTEYTVCKSEDWNAEAEKISPAPYHRYRDMIRAFAAMVNGEQENPYTYDYELALYKTLLRCCE
ncbi:MAG: Gfo/Idh/MocA family oxidoreductase [Clostridia bacterium]|nr:Gfo/Idh/MocA family oxidoreductase [Clostridia bacterium]